MTTVTLQVTLSDGADSDPMLADKLATITTAALRNTIGADTYVRPLTDLLDEARRIIRQDYYDDVRRIADEFATNWRWTPGDQPDHFSDREAAIDWLHESLDGTQRVIYTAQAQEGMLATGNASAYADDFGAEGMVANGDINWSALMYAAMERDVYEDLSSRLDIDVNGEPESATDDCDYCDHERQEHSGEDPKGYCAASTGDETTCDCAEFEA